MKVQQITEENKLQDLLNLYKYLHPNDPVLEIDAKLQNLWRSILKDPNIFYIGAELAGKIISTCTITIIPNLTRGARPYGLIENVVTHPDFQKKGIASQVMKYALEIAREKNCYKIMLLTSRKDEEIFGFYEKAGFERGLKTGFVIYNEVENGL